MMQRLYISCFLFLSVVLNTAFAQQLPVFNQNYIVPLAINPSMAGYNPAVDIFMLHHDQWSSMPGAPVTSSIMIDSPIKSGVNGVGLNFYSDQAGIFLNTVIRGAYAHRFNLGRNKTTQLLVGASAGLNDQKIDFTKAVVNQLMEPYLFQTTQRKTSFNGSLGATVIWRGLEVGVAMPNVLKTQLEYADNTNNARYTGVNHFTSSLKYLFTVSKKRNITAYPYFVVRNTQNAPIQYDLSAVFDVQNKFWAAVTYRNNYAVNFNAGIRIYNAFTLGYSYDLITNSLSAYTGRSSEILLGFSIYAFEKKKEVALVDTDADGVPDEFDLEKDTPAGNMVNFQGKTIPLAAAVAGISGTGKDGTNKNPLDRDGDLVMDSVDVEPDSPYGVLVDQRGKRLGNSNDMDGDGVDDSIDEELNTHFGAKVDAKGRRMVGDKEDLDKDGVLDVNDAELNTAEGVTVDEFGRMKGGLYDLDSDGVVDSLDLEPNSTLGLTVNRFGQTLEDSVKILYETSFFFDLDKALIKPGHEDQFAEIAHTLLENPDLNIILSGHTDTRGSAAYNLNLGQRRAQAIANILMRDYNVKPERISVVMSKGKSEPLSLTKHNINRRVDVRLENRKFLMK